ncbi:MAG: shikimate dehydrogenase [Hydrogenothermaceae bacterium]
MFINGETAVYGIFGYPVKHSKSPTFQTESFRHLGINAVYVPFEVKPENLQEATKSLKILNIKGINVTIPHKEEIINYLDEVSQEAKIIGAVNTVKNIDGYLIGYNTDAYGFIEGLKEIIEIEGKTALVIGAGGASRSVIYGLLQQNISKIYLANRTLQRAIEIVNDFGKYYRVIDQIVSVISLNQIDEVLENVNIVVNTTSVGLKDDDKPLFDYDRLQEKHTVVDIIYRETMLLKKAKEKGCKYQDGYPMLIYQGAKSFEIWTGQKALIEVMKRVLGI